MSKQYIKWGAAVLAIAVLGVFILNIVGRSFIKEVTHEVVLSGQEERVFGIDIDESAPYWELQDLDGNTVVLSDFLGQPVIMTFWTSWNLMSADQIKIFDEYISGENEALFKIVTINNQEDKSIVANFMRRGGYQVRVLLDETGETGELYKVRTLPATYFIDKGGVVRDVFIGVLSKEMFVKKAEIIIR